MRMGEAEKPFLWERKPERKEFPNQKLGELVAQKNHGGQLHQDHVDGLQRVIRSVAMLTPIHPTWVAHCVNQVKQPDSIIVNELSVPTDFLDLSQPRSYINSSHAGGLGFGLGAALGAKLAAADRDVILLVGDGSYLFGNPTAAHFVGRAQSLATLTVVTNNQSWNSVRSSTLGMYPDGRTANTDCPPLVALTPSPAFEKTIEACGGYGERVVDPVMLPAALERALDAVADGTPALLNVITQPWDRV